MEILPTGTDLAEEALTRSSEGCRALADLLLDGPVQQLSGLALSVSAAAAAFSSEDAGQHLLRARTELLERYARLTRSPTAPALESQSGLSGRGRPPRPLAGWLGDRRP